MAAVAADVNGPVTVTVSGGKAANVFGCNNLNGAPKSTVAVTVSGTETVALGSAIGNVYGGGNLAAYTGSPTVTISGGTVNQVYGGGLGASAIVDGSTSVTISGTAVVGNDVFGGGSEANVTGSVSVSVTGGQVINDVYGGGEKANTNTGSWDTSTNTWKVASSSDHDYYVAVKHLKTGDDVSAFYTAPGTLATGTYVEGTTYYKKLTYPENIFNIIKAKTDNVYGESIAADGHTPYTTTVSLTGGVIGNAYGGGLGKLGTGEHYSQSDCNAYNATLPGHLSTAALTDEQATAYNETISGAIPAGSRLTAGEATEVNTALNLTGSAAYATDGTAVISAAHAKAYNNTLTGHKSAGETLTEDQANTYNATLPGAVTTTDWKTHPGDDIDHGAVKAMVYGDVDVTVNGTAFTDDVESIGGVETVAKHGRVFGCNNLNGTPKGKVTVIVNATKRTDGSTSHVRGELELQGVYGGGNLANYEPETYDNPDNAHPGQTEFGQKTKVIIDGCSNVSINKVYGGGNAASVPFSDVTIEGAYEIGYVFGGGNGGDKVKYNETEGYQRNPGADVTHYANVMLKGGTIGQAFGGSDTRGTVGGTDVQQSTSADCPLRIVNLYGAGNGDQALSAGNINVIVSACGEGSEVQNVFGGSYKANIKGDVTLTIKSGIFTSVYGGNDRMGSIGGDITINIEETDGCEKPIIIQNLYGGCYQTAYPGAGAKAANGDDFPEGNITVNVKSATRIDRIFGGSENGAVTGNTTVNINMTRGSQSGHSGVALPSYYGETGATIPSNITVTGTDGYVIVHGLVTDADVAADPTKERSSVVGYYTKVDTYTPVGGVGTLAQDGITYYSKSGDVYTQETVTVGVTDVSGFYTITATSYPEATGFAVAGTTYYKQSVKGDIADEIGTIGEVYGGGNRGNVSGNAIVNIVTETSVNMVSLGEVPRTVYGAHIDGNVYGGGKLADVLGNTTINICAKKSEDVYVAVAEGTDKVTIGGNIYGGGEGDDGTFQCEKAMIGTDGHGSDEGEGNTLVAIGNGSIGGNVYGGGQIARVENNTTVRIGIGAGVASPGDATSAPAIAGNVFGAGKGISTHGYSALVRGKSSVTVEGNAKVGGTVYGGGEIASVGRFNVADEAYHASHPEVPIGMPYSLKEDQAAYKSGTCEVVIGGYAEIGPDDMQMPQFTGHVFGAGKGFLPEVHTYSGADKPKRMQPGNIWDTFEDEAAYIVFVETTGMCAATHVTIKDHAFVKGSVYGGSENGHVLNNTYVKIQDDCQVGNGWNTSTNTGVNSRYTPAEWAYDVTANDANFLYECNHWPYGENQGTEGEPKWVYLPYDIYNLDNGTPKAASDGHTFYGNVFGGGSGFFPYRTNPNWSKNDAKSLAEGMPVDANGYSNGLWLRSAGAVYGNTRVDITGGHILTSVYGGNEQTDVGKYLNDSLTPEAGTGTCVVNMVGGTLGVPRTLQQIHDHPVTCYLFGAGKGDQRINFNTWTNVGNTEVNISGTARIYGSTFGGGEDGHVIGDAVTNIGGTVNLDLNGDGDTSDEGETFTVQSSLKIGTWGTSYVDGNVFGGGRGFSGEAETAGSIGGNVAVNISDGTMLGSIYGGGRLASVGTYFVKPTLENGQPNPKYGQLEEDEGGKTYGHIAINISGGTIGGGTPSGTTVVSDVTLSDINYSGNVYGGCMGRITLLDNTLNPIWPELAQAKTAIVNISQPEGKTTHITGNVYGGGEFGSVRENAWVTIGGKRTTVDSYTEEGTITAEGAPTIDGSVFGGGKGSADYADKTTISVYWGSTEDVSMYTYTPMQWAGTVGGNTYVNVKGGAVKKNVYGGGELASVGLINYNSDADGNYSSITKHEDLTKSFALSWPYKFQYVPCNPTDENPRGKATVTITGGRIGTVGAAEGTTGYVFGGGKGKAMERYKEAFCANVRETEVTINYSTTPTIANSAAATTYFADASNPGIQAAVYGGGEDGHVIENTALSITGGVIGYSVYAGGKGFNKYSTTLKNWRDNGATTVAADIYSITAGKVYGNTSFTMSGGHVIRNVYGGGYMASVGKGNYAGGTDDYSNFNSPMFGQISGYGETLAGNLWDGESEYSQAFLGSGKATVTVTGGTVGTVDGIHKGLPTGNVIGGAQGEPAPNVFNMPVHEYNPVFHVGNINEAEVIIGTSGSATGPRLYGSVYGGGRDGHMRRDAKVTIYSGEIGNAYTSANQTAVGTSDLTHLQWQHRGNVYGSGSGIGTFEFDYDGDNETYTDSNGNGVYDEGEPIDSYDFDGDGDGVAETHYDIDHSFLAGCVARFSEVDIQGGIIHRNVYGGGSVAGTGMPKFYGQDYEPYKKGDTEHGQGYQSMSTVSISGGTIGEEGYGGDVFGASRGEAALLAADSRFATAIWTKVDIKPYKTGEDTYDYTKSPVIHGDVYGGGELGKVNMDTEVNLTGGTIGSTTYGGDVYGGGKGNVAVAADIGGNTTVLLNQAVDNSAKGCSLTRIFGCNNLNGTPKGHVLVHVYKTQHKNQTDIQTKYAKFKKLSDYTIENYSNNTADDDLTKLANTVGLTSSEIEELQSAISGGADDNAKKTALENMIEAIADKKYDVLGVYGGGDMAMYDPTDASSSDPLLKAAARTEVIIDGCAETSIKQVYGGGNAAPVPATSLTVNAAYEIHEAFGGGNGKDNNQLSDGYWYENPGANVGYKNFRHYHAAEGDPTGTNYGSGTSAAPYLAIENSDATTKEWRQANYLYGQGEASTGIIGGRIHRVYGGSNKRGNISKLALSVYETSTDCPVVVDESVAAGKEAAIDGEARVSMNCMDYTDAYYAAEAGDVNSDVTLNISNGHFGKVFGGNNKSGRIRGSITINVQESSCKPIVIDELYGAGFEAAYSIYGYNSDQSPRTREQYEAAVETALTGVNKNDAEAVNRALISHDLFGYPKADPRINIISATKIGTIYGGGYNALVVGSPHINVNMQPGIIPKKYVDEPPTGMDYSIATHTKEAAGTEPAYTYTVKSHADNGDAVLAIGSIGSIYGGGNLADINGNTSVDIGTGRWISAWDASGYPVWESLDADGAKFSYRVKTAAETYSQEECDEYNAGLADAISTSNAYSFTSYGSATGSPEYGTGKVKVVSAADGWTTVLVIANSIDGFVGNTYKVNATTLNAETYYQLYSTEGTEQPIWVKVATLTVDDVNTYNGTLVGARNTNDVKTAAEWQWYDASGAESTGPTTTGRNAATITDNVFGGGKGETHDSGDGAFQCASAMVGVNGEGLIDANGGTTVTIGNGSVGGNVYGGGEIGRVEKNTVVTIGLEGNTTNELIIGGSVFGAGKGVPTHGYSALVRGNSTVTVQGKAKVRGSVYGGGEIASVGRYTVNPSTGLPTSLANEKSGNCTVIIRDDAEIGPDDMVMNNTTTHRPDDAGHVFGAGKGATPYIDKDGNSWAEPWRIKPDNNKDIFNAATYTDAATAEIKFLSYLETLGLATKTEVTISGNAFVKGSVYGGAESGFVQHDTHVTIQDNCQIGNGYVQMDDDGTYLERLESPVIPMAVNRRYSDEEWTEGHLIATDTDPDALKTLAATYYTSSLPECASWPYGQHPDETVRYAPYDPFALESGYYDAAKTQSAEGGRTTADDGHTFFGNVFGGGSGYYPYKPGKWHSKAGNVGGNTVVDITGGHILTNVYGGNEMTDVGDGLAANKGRCTINFGGTATLGVPRTLGQIAAHPVTCGLYGAGKGDQRVLFDKRTNVKEVVMEVTGGTIYGSVFGGGEDGHVLGDVQMTISDDTSEESHTSTKIGTWGTSYVDGNVFGGGRGFSGNAMTAGNVGGSVDLDITGGEILGSVYGGGRMASVGYGLFAVNESGYGQIQTDNVDELGGTTTDYYTTTGLNKKGRGYVDVNISGGTIGNDLEYKYYTFDVETDDVKWSEAIESAKVSAIADLDADKVTANIPNTEFQAIDSIQASGSNTRTYIYRLTHTKGGNVFAGGMGRFLTLDGSYIPSWFNLGNVKQTKLTISQASDDVPTIIRGNVYGGCEYGQVTGTHKVADAYHRVKGTDEKDEYAWPETLTDILILGGTIGSEVKNASGKTQYTYGSVFGSGFGDPKEKIEYTDDKGTVDTEDDVTYESNPKFSSGLVEGGTKVEMQGGTVLGSVHGGGQVANVHGNSSVTVTGGTIGMENMGDLRCGNVYGGGFGNRTIVRCGQIYGNATVNIGNTVADAAYHEAHPDVEVGTVLKSPTIYHQVYGGGAYGSVGQIKYKTDIDPVHDTPKVYGVLGLKTLGNPDDSEDHGDFNNPPSNTMDLSGIIDPSTTGRATVTITGGTIGSDGLGDGNVFGSSFGDVANPMQRDDFLGWVYDTQVTIGDVAKGIAAGGTGLDFTTPLVKGNVYGSGDNGHTFHNANVAIHSGTIGLTAKQTADPTGQEGYKNPNRGNVYGSGNGTETYNIGTTDLYKAQAGIVYGNTTVTIDGGHVVHNVYGGGEMASVGKLTNDPQETAVRLKEGSDTEYETYDKWKGTYQHSDEENGFALSWPYEYLYGTDDEGNPAMDWNPSGGKATVTISGGRIGGEDGQYGGDVFGGSKGMPGNRYDYDDMSNVRETEVNIAYSTTADIADLTDITKPGIAGSVHGGPESGHVAEDAHVTLTGGLIGHSLYGGGKGTDQYTIKLAKIGATPTQTEPEVLYANKDYYDTSIYSLTAGKVYGNTHVTMTGGHVARNVYGGGNIASVGKGNYAGGTDDYYPAGYGETLTGTLWTPSSGYDPDKPLSATNAPQTMTWADHFLTSGKTYVEVLGGTVGYVDETDPSKSTKDGLPYGNVIGGSHGEAAPNVPANLRPRYHYCPAFFSGYVNETHVTIGGGYRCIAACTDDAGQAHVVGETMTTAEIQTAYSSGSIPTDKWEAITAPKILGSVYGGGQDGHVRRDTHVEVNGGEIGLPFTYDNRVNRLKTLSTEITKEDALTNTSDLDNEQWLYRGNVFGAGSGITKYTSTLQYVEGYPAGSRLPESGYSTSAGSVTRFTQVDVNGGIIHRNVYGGGSLASVGPPRINQDHDPYKKGDTEAGHGVGHQSQCTVNIAGQVGTPDGYGGDDTFKYNEAYGGEVYGASRGNSELDASQYSSTIWTLVRILKTANIMGNVFGGGDAGMVKRDTDVRIGDNE